MSTEITPTLSWNDRTLRRVLACFAIILAVLLLVVVTSLRNLNRSIATSDWVNHTHALLTEVDALLPTLEVAEGALGKYLLTSDERDHVISQDKFAELGERVDVATALAADSPQDRELFAPIAALLAHRAELAAGIIHVKNSAEPTVRPQNLNQETDQSDQRKLELQIEKFRGIQTGLLSARDRASFVQAQTTRWTVICGVVLDFLLLAGAAWLIRDDLASRRLAARLLEVSNEQLEVLVRERTAELSLTNEQLVIRNLEERWAKLALEHQNRYNLLIIDSITDAVFVVTKLLKISRLNPAAIHLTGLEPVDLIDQPLSRVLRLASGGHVPNKTTYDPLLRTLVDGHEMRDKAALVISNDGQTTPVRLSIYPLRDRDKVVGGVVILQAIVPASP